MSSSDVVRQSCSVLNKILRRNYSQAEIMFFRRLIFICILSLLNSVAWTLDKLPGIKLCKLNDSNINECLKETLQQLTPLLKNSIHVEKSNFEYSDGFVQGRAALRNVTIYGMENLNIEKVNFKLENGHLSLEQILRIPNLYIEGLYKADMKINDFKITPKGYFNITMSDVVIKSQPEGEVYERDDGHSYLKLTKFNVDPTVDDMKIYATGLVSDPTLSAIILDFVNDYWRTIYKSFVPSIRSSWEPIMIRAANEILSTLPIDLLLTEH